MSADTRQSRFIVTREDLAGASEPVTVVSEGLRIGRTFSCDIVLDHPSVSRLHAGIKEAQGHFRIFNFSPTSVLALTVNGRAVPADESVVVTDGDVAQIGPFSLHFRREPDALHIRVALDSALPVGAVGGRGEKRGIGEAPCPRCGESVSNGQAFCPRCGAVVGETPLAAKRKQSPPPHAPAASRAAPASPPGEMAEALKVFWSKRKREAGRMRESEQPEFQLEVLRGPRRSAEEEEYATRLPLPPQSLVKRIGKKLHTLARKARRAADCDPVDCTVFSPSAVKRGQTFMAQVFAHRPDQTRDAQEMAKEFDSATARRGFASLEAEVRRGAKLTIHLSLPDFHVVDPVQSLTWRGRPESAQFEIRVPADTSRETVIGTVTVSEDGVPLGHVKFKITVETATAGQRDRAVLSTGESAQRYRKAFISYASQDRAEVLKRVQMLARLKIKFFQDVLDLEPGARWEQQLYRHIDESDLFLLFWSSAAKQSEWVLNEVKYALARKQGDDTLPPEIIPVIIEGPPPAAPPPELAHLHFNDYLIYFMAPPDA